MLIMVNQVQWLTTSQAAHRLGVKPATLYAYVSRGIIESHRDEDRTSRFRATDVEALAVRGRPREASRHHSLDIEITTQITEIVGHSIRYRGHDALTLARMCSFEQVAELLWTGELPLVTPFWAASARPLVIPGELSMRDHLRLVAAQASVGAHERRDLRSVADEGRRLIAAMVDSLPIAGDGRCPRLLLPDGVGVRGSLAGRLWSRLSPRRSTPELIAAMNAALVLLADHEMAASTLAARVAASTRAGVHGVVAAGMGTLSGPMHGGESQRARRLLDRATVASAHGVILMALELHGRLPGFGQVLYPSGDPRAALLLEMLRDAAGSHPAVATADTLIAAAARRRLPPPNVDFALAVLGMVAAMPEDGGEAIFTPARVVGWLAHAMEEYDERPLRFRPRALYVGASG